MRDAVVVAIIVVAVTATCLWLLFRDGSMAHRAARDYADDLRPTGGEDTQTAEGQESAGGV